MPVPAISVVVPTSGKPERLVLALHSLVAQSIGTSWFETIVVADGTAPGTDHAVALARAAGLPTRLLRTPAAGQAAARNRGAAAARTPNLLFMDDDVLLSPDYVAAMLGLIDDDAGLVARAPVYVLRYLAPFRDPERGIRFDGGRLQAGSGLGSRLVTRRMVRRDWPAVARQCIHRNRFERLVSQTLAEGPDDERWLGYSGSGVALPRRLFEEAGGYDEGFGLRWGAEAVELGYRLMRLGAAFIEADGIFSAHMDHPRETAMASFSESFDYFFDRHGDPAIRRVEAKIRGGDRWPERRASASEQA
ncbi:glycosyltransferase family A protein [Aurantimonas sp. HBX-1]|uniref:glycosyltransferase family A protein n=1 Tax=Aurantimonas sp. HBX-1 TaxID=2906072 RepID=UPI001F402D4C|nr:glycosyltransferase family 2 protein [Aurantimonas sp. HBX-1]UIJ73278.1 glycosyltransferase family 2 protein [Aurantimonas sp. HBX-1]